MTKLNSTDLTAKLLATENLTVIRSSASTASFDVGARVLTLPLWKDMTPEIESLFIQHEVGHALFTNLDEWIGAIDSFPKEKQRVLKGYMNVVEDARIEKLMKRRFPGARKSFFSGYKQLLERDFFELKGKSVSTMLLIDRINLYFKAGNSTDLSFTPEEKVFVDRIDRCETMSEMVELSKELYDFTKVQLEQRRKEAMSLRVDIEYDEDDAEDDDVYVDDMDSIFNEDENENENEEDENGTQKVEGEDDEEEKNKTGNASGGNSDAEYPDEELESETDNALNRKLEELADTSTEYRYYEVETKSWHDPVVSYKQVLADTTIVDERIVEAAKEYGYDHKKEFTSFMIESERMVNYLVKEFEMRKSAQAFRRAQTAKSGSLNMNKLHAYKITDDIFRRVTTIPNGQNHGMVFLLDWSGSMQDVIIPTIKQVINLAMFCRRINIPFEVFAFTGQYYGQHMNESQLMTGSSFNHAMARTEDRNVIFSDGYFSLLNIFSSKMTNHEFQTIARRFTSYYVSAAKGYSMGDTPLNEALVEMLKFIPEYKRRNNIEKLTLITLSDGAGGQLRMNRHLRTWDWKSLDRAEKIKYKNFITDPETGRNYELVDQSWSMTEILLRMIKERNDITLLGFYVCRNSRRVLNDVYRDHFGQHASDYQIEEMRKGFRQDGFFSIKNTGRDDLFIVPDTSTKIVDENLEVNDNMSASQIAKKFAKTMNTKKHSRILLDKFIGWVA